MIVLQSFIQFLFVCCGTCQGLHSVYDVAINKFTQNYPPSFLQATFHMTASHRSRLSQRGDHITWPYKCLYSSPSPADDRWTLFKRSRNDVGDHMETRLKELARNQAFSSEPFLFLFCFFFVFVFCFFLGLALISPHFALARDRRSLSNFLTFVFQPGCRAAKAR